MSTTGLVYSSLKNLCYGPDFVLVNDKWRIHDILLSTDAMVLVVAILGVNVVSTFANDNTLELY